MSQGSGICETDNFPEGITNGAKWYIVKGGMQDFNYLFSNCFEITVEMSCCKYPLEDSLKTEWKNNKESLLKYLESVHIGVKGFVKDKIRKPVENAEIVIDGIEKTVKTTKKGEFWRLLAPGSYRIKAKLGNVSHLVARNRILRLSKNAKY
jgi:carboxypeptidase D